MMDEGAEKEEIDDSVAKLIDDKEIVNTEAKLDKNEEVIDSKSKLDCGEEVSDNEEKHTEDENEVETEEKHTKAENEEKHTEDENEVETEEKHTKAENEEKLIVDDEVEIENTVYKIIIERENSQHEFEEEPVNSEKSLEKVNYVESIHKNNHVSDTENEHIAIRGISPAFTSQTKPTEIILYPPNEEVPQPNSKRVLVLKPEPPRQFTQKRRRIERKRTRNITCTFIIIAILLCLVTASYLVGGTWLFLHLEEMEEVSYIKEFAKLKNDTAILLATELRQVKAHEAIWSQYVFKHLDIFEEAVLRTTGLGYWRQDIDEGKQRWAYPNTLFYSLSLITTTGYGSMTPRSKWGRTATVCYSFIGIPLMISWLICMGHFFALCWSWMFDSICCRFCCLGIEDESVTNQQSPRSKTIRTKRNSIAPEKIVPTSSMTDNSNSIHEKTLGAERTFSAGNKFQINDELERACVPINNSFRNKSAEVFRGNFENSVVDHKLNDLDHAVSIVFAVIFFAVYFVFGSAVFALIEQLSITDILYFNYLMFVSMGPGCYELQDDIAENKIKGNLCYIIYLIIGYVTLSMIFNLIYMYFYPSLRIYQSRKLK